VQQIAAAVVREFGKALEVLAYKFANLVVFLLLLHALKEPAYHRH
jgi:hypothetical protein